MKILNEKNDPNRPKGLKGATEGWSPDQVKEINKWIVEMQNENKEMEKRNAELLKLGKERQALREIKDLERRQKIVQDMRDRVKKPGAQKSLGDFLREKS